MGQAKKIKLLKAVSSGDKVEQSAGAGETWAFLGWRFCDDKVWLCTRVMQKNKWPLDIEKSNPFFVKRVCRKASLPKQDWVALFYTSDLIIKFTYSTSCSVSQLSVLVIAGVRPIKHHNRSSLRTFLRYPVGLSGCYCYFHFQHPSTLCLVLFCLYSNAFPLVMPTVILTTSTEISHLSA